MSRETWGQPAQRQSRRLRDCDWCVQPIQKGERYVHWWGLSADGVPASADLHPECLAAISEEGYEDAAWGEEHARGLTTAQTGDVDMALRDIARWAAGR